MKSAASQCFCGKGLWICVLCLLLVLSRPQQICALAGNSIHQGHQIRGADSQRTKAKDEAANAWIIAWALGHCTILITARVIVLSLIFCVFVLSSLESSLR